MRWHIRRQSADFRLPGGAEFLVWGDIYSIFPALTSDQFGRKYASTNYALLYTAKGCAALFVPLGSFLAAQTGNWFGTLMVAALADVVAAFLMFGLVRPCARARIAPAANGAALAGGLSALTSIRSQPIGRIGINEKAARRKPERPFVFVGA